MALLRRAVDDGGLCLQEPPVNILSRLLARPPALPPVPARAGHPGCSEDDTERPGCGWFDSSHELQSGLWVQEHASPDDVAAELPLASWLELHLAGWRSRPLV